jgi:hypothetical protein
VRCHTVQKWKLGFFFAGGFTGHFDDDGHVIFGETAATINKAIEAEFPPDSGKPLLIVDMLRS